MDRRFRSVPCSLCVIIHIYSSSARPRRPGAFELELEKMNE